MCSPAIIERVKKRITRRNLLQGIEFAEVASSTDCLSDQESSNRQSSSSSLLESVSFSRVADLVIPCIPIFPSGLSPSNHRREAYFCAPCDCGVKTGLRIGTRQSKPQANHILGACCHPLKYKILDENGKHR